MQLCLCRGDVLDILGDESRIFGRARSLAAEELELYMIRRIRSMCRVVNCWHELSAARKQLGNIAQAAINRREAHQLRTNWLQWGCVLHRGAWTSTS